MLKLTHEKIVGVDEAGRGPLAGPLVVAAAILLPGFDAARIDDSKKLKESTREHLFEQIKQSSLWNVQIINPDEIDRLNILQATMEGMRRCILALGEQAESALIDGNRIPHGLPIPAEAVVKGDGEYACIAAASILAKVTRDRLMKELSKEFPEYEFEKNLGYPTPEHLAILRELGPTPIHRFSYAPVIEAKLQPCLTFES